MTNKFTTVVVIADQPNKNGRIYPKALLEREIERFTPQIGQIGPPDDSIISMGQASHKINQLEMIDDKLVAHIEIMNTPCGKTLEKILPHMKFRLRGIGAIKDGIVQESYRLITIDAYPKDEAS